MKTVFILLLSLVLEGISLLQAAPSCTPQPQQDLPKATLLLGTNIVTAQIAADNATRELGLMSHTNLGDAEGMIFVFPGPRPVTFWMKDTPTPLAIAYIGASGRIMELHEMKPFDETPVPSESQAIVYALEVAKGWFSRHGVLPGDVVAGLPSPLTAK